VPLVVLAPVPPVASWPYLGTSVVLHVVYNLLLMKAYRLAEFGQVYPLARGTSPLLVTVLAAVFVGEVPPVAELVGVVVVSVGLGSLVFLGGRPGRRELPAVLAAPATGLAIATYSTVDGIGVRTAGSALGYTGWLVLLECVAIPVIAFGMRGRKLVGQLRPRLWHGLCGGALSLLAYGLVLWAQTQGPLAPIAALRETSIIVGAIIGTVVFRERFGHPRIAATVVVFLGIAVLNLS
ncbi:MAG: EamA family transporter, partial [Streptosporangiales bacterium]|nr:EamA family transporter [Streptosporangiales bacterium]